MGRHRHTGIVAIALLAVLAAVGCGEDEPDAPGATTSDTRAVPERADLVPSPVGTAPDTWFAVEHRDGAFVLVQGERGSEETTDLATFPADAGQPDTSIPVSVTDVAVAVDANRAFVATCCEPVSGSISEIALDGVGPEDPIYRDQGRRVDAVGDAFVRADTVGVVEVDADPTDPADQVSLVDASAIDVSFGGGGLVIALARADGDEDSDVGSVIRAYSSAGEPAGDHDLAAPHCAVIGTTEAVVVTAGMPERVGDEQVCMSDRFTIIPSGGDDTTSLGTTSFDAALPGALQDLETDASGSHLIGVDEAGRVVQVTDDDTVVPLSVGGHYVAADW